MNDSASSNKSSPSKKQALQRALLEIEFAQSQQLAVSLSSVQDITDNTIKQVAFDHDVSSALLSTNRDR